MTLLINFGRPLTPEHLEHITRLADRSIDEVRDVASQVDEDVSSLHAEVQRLIEQTRVVEDEWSALDVLVILPGLAIVAALLALELQFLCGVGHLQLVRFKPVGAGAVTTYQPAEILVA